MAATTNHISLDALRAYRDSPLAFFAAVLIEQRGRRVPFGQAMADFQREAFEAAAPCLQAVAAGRIPPRRGLWLERTKGASKDSDIALCVLWLLLFSPRPLACETGADNQEQAAEMLGAAKEWVRINPWMGQRVEFLRDRAYCSQTGSRLDFLTTPTRNESNATHGSRPDVTIINELSHISVEGFAATMADNGDKKPGNLMMVATNAGSIRGWQWKWRELYRAKAQASVVAGGDGTSTTTPARWYFQKYAQPAPWISRANLEEARVRNSKTRYDRLWLGVWSTGDGDAIDQADLDACITLAGPQDGPLPGWAYGAGLDLSTKRDHSALVVIGTELGSGRVAVVRVMAWQPDRDTGVVDLPAVRAAVWDAHETFGLCYVGYDATQAVLMAQDLAARGVPMQEVYFAGKNLDLMASTIMQVFRDRHIDLYPDADLIRDIGRLAIEEKKFGHKLSAARSDDEGHADRAIALAIGLPVMLEVSQMQIEPDTLADAPRRVTT